jgi:hypothetical protein
VKKWLALLLLIISITGSVVPCCSGDDCADEANESRHNDHKQDDKGACSPFYACGSCVPAVEVTAIRTTFAEIKKEKPDHFSIYQFQLGRYSASLFQPPRPVFVS